MSKAKPRKPTIKEMTVALNRLIIDMDSMSHKINSLRTSLGLYVKFNKHEGVFQKFAEEEHSRMFEEFRKAQEKQNEPKTENK
jgi:hypothetical protein